MNENIDLTKILKNCPKGFELYSTLHGKVNFVRIDEEEHPIIFMFTDKGVEFTSRVSSEGKYLYSTKGECILFPSKDQRDWSKFTAPWYNNEESIKPKFKVGDKIRHKETNKNDVYEISKVYDDSYGIVGFNWGIYIKYQDKYELVPNKFDPKTLKSFDKVLVRDDELECWRCAFYSHQRKGKKDIIYRYATTTSSYACCIPYNEETKHLVGTKKEAPEYYKYWEDWV